LANAWRESELSALTAIGDDVKAGASRSVIIQGAADMGKSHLAASFAKALGDGWLVRNYTFRDARSKGPMNELVKIAGDFGAGNPPTNWTYVDEAFLLSKSGLLIFHSGSGGGDVDEDILGSMLTAVQDFVKDSFGDSGKKGGLNELSYKGLQIMIEHGEHTFIACVVSRGEHPSMRGDIQRSLREIENSCSDRLCGWDGDVDSLPEIPVILDRLMAARFPRVSIDSEEAIAQQNLRFEWLRMAVNNSPFEKPVLLILEDLHNADRTSLQGLAYVIRGVRSRPILFIMSMRDGEAPQYAKDLVAKLAIEGHISVLDLKPVGQDCFPDFLSEVMPGAEVTESVSKEIFHAVGGVPGSTVKLVKILVKEGRLVSEEGIWALKGRRAPWWSTGTEAAHRSMERLPPRVLDLLELVAVHGRPADLPMLVAALHLDEAKLAKEIDLAVASGMAERGPDGAVSLETIAVEEAVKAGMGPVRTAMWHRGIAAVIMAAHRDGKDAPVFELAMHLAEGHDSENGIEYCLRAAELSSAEYAFPESIKFYNWSVELMERTGGDARYLATLQRLGEVQNIDGDFREEIRTCERMLAFEGLDRGERAEILRRMGWSHNKLGDSHRARELLQRALAEIDAGGDALERTRIQNYLAMLISKSAPAEALPIHEAYLQAATGANSLKDIALAHKAIGGVHFYTNRYDEAILSWKDALKAYDSLNDDFGRSDILVNLGVVYNIKGDAKPSLDALDEGIAIKEKIGDYRRMASALNNLGIAFVSSGGFEKAIESHKRSLEIKVRIGDLAGTANTYNNLGILYWEQGKVQEAVEHYGKALAIWTRLDDILCMTKAHNNLGVAYGDLGNLGACARHADFALVIAKQKNFLEMQVLAKTSLARVASGKGDWPKAEATFADAIQTARLLNAPRELGFALFYWGQEGAKHGDAKSRQHLEEALAVLEKAGAKPLAERARALLEKTGK
jgi:tetratricopeptide (TPR) repeat protein